MADRTEYYRLWYLENKTSKVKKTYAWLKKKKQKLGVIGFKEWKSKQNKKYRKKIKTK